MEVMPLFSKRLKELRESAGLTQTQLADKLDVSRGSISFYENGDRIPDIEFLARVSDEFKVSADWLIGLSSVRSIDLNVKGVCEYTGLSEESLDMVLKYKNAINTAKNHIIGRLGWQFNQIVSSSEFFFLMRDISRFLEFSFYMEKNCTEDNPEGQKYNFPMLQITDVDLLDVIYNQVRTRLGFLIDKLRRKAENSRDITEAFFDFGDPPSKE